MGIFNLIPSKIPEKGLRKQDLDSDFLYWVNVTSEKYRSDPDYYILAKVLRTFIKLTIAYASVVLVFALSTTENTHLYWFLRLLNYILPFSIIVMAHYHVVFLKNVNIKSYSFITSRETGKVHSAAPLILIVAMPCLLYLIAFPGSILSEYLHRPYIHSELSEYFNSQIFLFIIGLCFVLVYSLSAYAFFGFLQALIQAYQLYKQKNEKELNNDS